MSGFKENVQYGAGQYGAQVTPDEMDRFETLTIINPSLSAVQIGTVTSATANAAFVLDNIRPDYPRTLLVSILGVAGGMGGTVTVNGYDHFGGTQTETVGFASANGGGSVATTKIFSRVVSGSIVGLDGLGGTAVGTARIGYAVGTAANLVAKFGLPTKIAAVTDVRRITYTSQGVGGTALNGGTIGTANIDISDHSFKPNRVLAGTEIYQLSIKSTYDNSGKPNMTLA